MRKLEFFNLTSFLLSLCIHQRKTLSKRAFDFDAWFLPHVLPMGGTNGKVQSSPAINKCQDCWGCTVLQWTLYLKMRWEIFNLPLQYHKQMHADVLKPQLFPAPCFSQEDLFHGLSAQPSSLLWSSVPSHLLFPKCLTVAPNLPLLASSFLCSLDTNPPVIQLQAENQPWNDLLLGKFWLQRGGNQAKLLWNISHHLGVGNPTNPFTTPLK